MSNNSEFTSSLLTLLYRTYGFLFMIFLGMIFLFSLRFLFTGGEYLPFLFNFANNVDLRLNLLFILPFLIILIYFLTRTLNYKLTKQYLEKDFKVHDLIKINPELTITENSHSRTPNTFSYNIKVNDSHYSLNHSYPVQLDSSNTKLECSVIPYLCVNDPILEIKEVENYYSNFCSQNLFILNITTTLFHTVYIFNKDTNSCIMVENESYQTPFLSLINWLLGSIFTISLIFTYISLFGNDFNRLIIIPIILSIIFLYYIFKIRENLESNFSYNELYSFLLKMKSQT